MKRPNKSFKVLFLLLMGILVIFAGLYAIGRSTKVRSTEEQISDHQVHLSDRAPQGKLISLNNGWSQYTVKEWNMTFAYPADWELSEKTYRTGTSSGLASVRVKGIDQEIIFDTIPGDLPAGLYVHYQHSTTTISGKATLLWEARYDGREGFSQFASLCAGIGEFGGSWLTVDSRSESKEVTNKIVSSIVCPK